LADFGLTEREKQLRTKKLHTPVILRQKYGESSSLEHQRQELALLEFSSENLMRRQGNSKLNNFNRSSQVDENEEQSVPKNEELSATFNN